MANNVYDIIIVHMISGATATDRHKKNTLGQPAACEVCSQLVKLSNNSLSELILVADTSLSICKDKLGADFE